MATAEECVCNTMQNYLIGAITFASVQAGGLDYLFALLKPFIPQSIYYILFFFMCGLKIAIRMSIQKFWNGVSYTKTYLHDTFFVNEDQTYASENDELKNKDEEEEDDDSTMDSETENQLEQCSDALITEPKNASSLLTMRKPRNFEKELGSSMLFK
jgi:hypothetical protein